MAAVRHQADGDLRTLSTDQLLSLIQEDIRTLDQVHRERLLEEFAPERIPLFAVTCCNKHLGDFPAQALVRCPYCWTWHRAGDDPPA